MDKSIKLQFLTLALLLCWVVLWHSIVTYACAKFMLESGVWATFMQGVLQISTLAMCVYGLFSGIQRILALTIAFIWAETCGGILLVLCILTGLHSNNLMVSGFDKFLIASALTYITITSVVCLWTLGVPIMGRDVEKGRGANSTLDQINKYLTNLPRHGRSVLSYRLFVAIALAVNTAWVVLIIHQRLSPTLGYYLVPALIIALGLILLGITLFSGFLAQVYGIGAFVCYCGLGTAISSIPPLARKAIWSSPDSVRIALIIGLLSVSLVMSIIGIAVTLALSKNE